MRTPIFDQLVTETVDPPICTICGRVWFTPYEIHHGICDVCFICNRHLEPEMWHCADCGEFLTGLERMVFVTGMRATIVCPDHFSARQSAA